MPQAGQILRHKQFAFLDGEKGDKLCIVLNTGDNTEACLVLKTTSQKKHYPQALPGCNSSKSIFCIYEECDQGFPKDTYVQLDNVYPIDVDILLENKQVTFVDHLTEVCFKNLKRCLRNFKEDIPKRYWTIIYS